jgi:D-alanyl-D-alanine carboxypeptidase (penicillin-binding protein 5/6)
MYYKIFIAFSLLFSSFLIAAEQKNNLTLKVSYAYVEDFYGGLPLFSLAENERLYPASMTKVMSAYIIFKHLKNGSLSLNDVVVISANAYKKGNYRTGSSTMFLEQGQKVLVSDLIIGTIVVSGNDAAIALAEHISGSEQNFVLEMNEEAKKLGLYNTNFTNVYGWPDSKNYTTAKDLVELSRRLIIDFPEYYFYHSIKEFKYNRITQSNRNPLLGKGLSEGIVVDGLKTGHTEISKYSVALSAYNTDNPPFRILAVISGAASEKIRREESAKLIEWVYQNYKQITLYKKGELIIEIPVLYSFTHKLKVIAQEDIVVVVPKKYDTSDIKIIVDYPQYLLPEITKDMKVATLFINTKDDYFSKKYDLVSGVDINEQNIIIRFLFSPYYAIRKIILQR